MVAALAAMIYFVMFLGCRRFELHHKVLVIEVDRIVPMSNICLKEARSPPPPVVIVGRASDSQAKGAWFESGPLSTILPGWGAV